MAQEFTIKSAAIEDKINQILPSQGGFQPGVDFSASTMVVPIVDLTETAEGSSVREDLQTALTHNNATTTFTSNTTNTIVNTTGYYSVNFSITVVGNNTTNLSAFLAINDGTTDKIVYQYSYPIATGQASIRDKIVVKLEAGDSLKAVAASQMILNTTTRQIADISGNLINP